MKKKLSIKIITLFPGFINSFVDSFGIIKKAIQNKILDIKAINLREFGLDERQTVDDRPYGGGVGMVLRADVLYKAIVAAQKSKSEIRNPKQIRKSKNINFKTRTILLCPSGKKFEQKDAIRLAKYDELIFVSGRYEGFDERIRKFVDEEMSIGDYVLMGGELPALVISEAVMRLRPGILGKLESTTNESFANTLVEKIDGRQKNQQMFLEYPQYTKPEIWEVPVPGRGELQPPANRLKKSGRASAAPTLKHKKRLTLRVPKVLLTGHHANIEKWRKEEAKKLTKKRRPDLLEMTKMNKIDKNEQK
jgi:tRNA (guanine37-N1)-methyltransferase